MVMGGMGREGGVEEGGLTQVVYSRTLHGQTACLCPPCLTRKSMNAIESGTRKVE